MTDETKRLIALAQKGDEKAFEELIEKNTGLIKSVVRRFYGRGVSDEDLYQLGAMGLVKAVKRFDTSFCVEFSTYAVPMILGEIRRFLRDDGIIKVSRSIRERAAVIRRMKMEKEDVKIEDVATRLGITCEEAVLALEATTPPDSIDREVYDNSSATRLGDVISKDDEDEKITKMTLRQIVEELPERERQLILLRYYRELTQSQTAKLLNIGQVQVSRLEKKIISQIKEKMTS